VVCILKLIAVFPVTTNIVVRCSDVILTPYPNKVKKLIFRIEYKDIQAKFPIKIEND